LQTKQERGRGKREKMQVTFEIVKEFY
jgi:hypothetical protein